MWKSWLLILILLSGCSLLTQTPSNSGQLAGGQSLLQLRQSPEWELKEGSVYDGDTFRAINPKTQEQIKVRMACIDAV